MYDKDNNNNKTTITTTMANLEFTYNEFMSDILTHNDNNDMTYQTNC